MKYTTLAEIMEIKRLLEIKNDKISHLEKMLDSINTRILKMTTSQLKEAIRDIEGTRKEIAEEKKWCEKAHEIIRKFYRPATM